MISEHKITVAKREAFGTGAARSCRRSGMIPGVVYGSNQTPEGVSVDPKELARQLQKSGFFARVFTLDFGGEQVLALLKAIQRHPVTDEPLHVDFMRVSKDTRVNVQIPVRFINEDKAPILKRGGSLNIVNRRIEVSTHADAIPDAFTIDLSKVDLSKGVRLTDVTLPENVHVANTNRYSVIATVLKKGGKKTADESEESAAA